MYCEVVLLVLVGPLKGDIPGGGNISWILSGRRLHYKHGTTPENIKNHYLKGIQHCATQ